MFITDQALSGANPLPTERQNNAPGGELGQVNQRYLDRDGVRLFVSTRLSAAAPEQSKHLFLVHGAAHNHHTFDIVSRLLSPDIAVTRYDTRGHGNSSRPSNGGYQHQHFVDDLAAVIEATSIRHATVVASSIGGLHALQLQTQRPGLIGKLILIDILPSIDDRVVNNLRRFFGFREYSSFEDLVDKYSFLAPTRSMDDIRQEFAHSTVQDDNGKWSFDVDQKIIEIVAPEYLRMFQSLVPRISCPVVLMRGAESKVVPESAIEKFKADLPSGVPFSVVEIPKGGHCPWRENPASFTSQLENLLQVAEIPGNVAPA